MDKKEAVRLIRQYMMVHHIGEYPHIKLKEAMDMAIEALQEETMKTVHGRWEKYMEEMEDGFGKMHTVQTGVMCSECGHYSCCGGNFCKNCGAKMDGERRTDEN